jgi:hypothetical protein
MGSKLIIINAHGENGWRGANGEYLEVRDIPFGDHPDDDMSEEDVYEDKQVGKSYSVLRTKNNEAVVRKVDKSGTWPRIISTYTDHELKIRISDTSPAYIDNEDWINMLPSIDKLE